MFIRTFTGQDEVLAAAIEVAEHAAQQLLDGLSSAELFSVRAQTLIEPASYVHVVTIVCE